MTLVFSDTHLGKYDKKKDLFLRNLFKLLKSKNTTYIYGNHDYRAEYQKDLGDKFSNRQGIEYDLEINSRKYHFEHGHRYFFNTKNPLFVNYYYIIDKIPFLGPITNRVTELTYKVFPNKISKNGIATKRNAYVKEIKPKESYYVMSHTHIPDLDKENRYVNTGCMVGKFLSYIVIDDKGESSLIRKVLD